MRACGRTTVNMERAVGGSTLKSKMTRRVPVVLVYKESFWFVNGFGMDDELVPIVVGSLLLVISAFVTVFRHVL